MVHAASWSFDKNGAALSEEIPQANSSRLSADQTLGSEIFRCRPLSSMMWVSAQGLGVLGAYVALPFIIIPFFAMWPSLGVLLLLREEPRWLGLGAAGSCFLFCYAAFLWLVYFQPCGDYLVLHNNGFRLKITFKRREILFRDLIRITFGLESVMFDALTGFLHRFRPGQTRMIQEQASAAMNLYFRDGKKTVFKSFLFRFEPQDTQMFLDHVVKHHPELFGETSTG